MTFASKAADRRDGPAVSSSDPPPQTQRSPTSSTQARGRDQVGMRAYNERLVLSLLRQESDLARAEIARRTGLSAQTISVITRRLENDGLIVVGEPIKGKVGQPLKPISIAPDGAYALGLKIGRRSVDLILMNIVGEMIDRRRETYRYPTPAPILAFVEKAIESLSRRLPPDRRDRIAGLGVASPSFLWDWAEKVGADPGEMEVWREIDLGEAIQRVSPHPVVVENDMSAACGAELMFGHGRKRPDFLYFFIGLFIGGGLTLGGALYKGAHGNAGAVGPMPVALGRGRVGQLIDVASLFLLEEAIRNKGLDPNEALRDDVDWRGFERLLDHWIDTTAGHLARAIIATSAVVDMPLVVVDGGFPSAVKDRLVDATERALDKGDLRGVHRPEIAAGLVGHNARAIGGACLPLLERFLLDGAGGVSMAAASG